MGFSAPQLRRIGQPDSSLQAPLQGAVKATPACLHSNPTATPPRQSWAKPPFPHLRHGLPWELIGITVTAHRGPWHRLRAPSRTAKPISVWYLRPPGEQAPETDVSETVSEPSFRASTFFVYRSGDISHNHHLQLQSNLQLLKYSHKL